MQAADIMTMNVITVEPATEVREIAKLLIEHRISAVPVIDAERRVLGIVSEGDLMHRAESGTEQQRPWWLGLFASREEQAEAFTKSHGRRAADVMTRDVVTISEDMPVDEIARLLEQKHIKRMPVVRGKELVGIVSRANLLHALASEQAEPTAPGSTCDRAIREALLHTLTKEVGLDKGYLNVIVSDGVVQLWGIADSISSLRAAQVAAESYPGVRTVENNLGQVPPWIWAE